MGDLSIDRSLTVNGSCCMARGSWLMAHSPRLVAHGSWLMSHDQDEDGSWLMTKTRVAEPGEGPSAPILSWSGATSHDP